jgi:HEAT repeat protein
MRNKARETTMAIDWKAIARQIGGLQPDGGERIVGTPGGRRALEILIGEENLRDAVDYFISLKPGAFTAEMVLQIIMSEVAMNRCLEIYKSEPGTYRACSAVFLLGCMADTRALPWVREFLEDSNGAVRMTGLRVLQNILYGPLDDDDMAAAKGLFDKAESDPDTTVRERALDIRQHSVLHNRNVAGG